MCDDKSFIDTSLVMGDDEPRSAAASLAYAYQRCQITSPDTKIFEKPVFAFFGATKKNDTKVFAI